MRRLRTRWPFRAGLVAGVSILGFAALASVGTAVSPSSTPAASEQYVGKKAIICHKTGSTKNPFRTIVVSRNAVPAHLRHGDALGPCTTAQFTICDASKGKAPKTIKVKGAKAAAKHLRQGDKLGKCKKAKKQGASDRGKGSDKGKKSKGKPADTPGNGGDKGKGPKK